MQASQRTEANHALEFSVAYANRVGVPVVVCFGLDETYPEANLRHFSFLLEGLCDVRHRLKKRGIPFICGKGEPWLVALRLSEKAAAVVTDRGYLRRQVKWRDRLAEQSSVPVFQVESDAVVPVNLASMKQEFAARTIRPKLHRLMHDRCVIPEQVTVKHPIFRGIPLTSCRQGTTCFLELPGGDRMEVVEPVELIKVVSESLSIDTSVGPATRFLRGGEREALSKLDAFLTHRLKDYHLLRNDPGSQAASGLSPYLHFGQISPLSIVKRVKEAAGTESSSPETRDRRHPPKEAVEAFVEELFIRRELSLNYVTYNQAYDRFIGLPEWALNSLNDHADDRRPYLYSAEQLEAAETHDPYWNAAAREMLITGSMHNYMRMYWGKKVLEWSESPQQAFTTLLALNNKYCLDGRDPNSYVGVGWCFGLHDRPWKEREIFGKVRYMNARGLERKFDMSRYLNRIEQLERS